MRYMLTVLFIPQAPALFGISNLIIIIGAIILIAVVAAIIILVVFHNGGKAKQPTTPGAPPDRHHQGQLAKDAWVQQPQASAWDSQTAWDAPSSSTNNSWGQP